MAEIRTPQKQSFINKPIGVARTDAGEVQAAQQLANASRTLSNATFNTASQVMRAGMELQQNYEQRKFTEWAQQVPVIDENGEYAKREMPKYISGKTKDQINNVLQKRYATEADRRTKEYMIQARAKYVNNPNEEALFAEDVSLFVEENVKAIEQAGGKLFAQNFRDTAAINQSQHINSIRTKAAQRAEEDAIFNFESQVRDRIALLTQKASSGDPSAGEDLITLLADIEDSSDSLAISRRLKVDLSNQTKADFALASINNLGFEKLTDVQRARVIQAMAQGNASLVADFLPGLSELMSAGGVLSQTSIRNNVRSSLAIADSALSKIETAQRRENEILSALGSGSGKKARQASQLMIETMFGISQKNNPAAFAQAYKQNPQIADVIGANRAVPAIVKDTLDFFEDSVVNIDSVPTLISMAKIVQDSRLSVSGERVGDLGLDANNIVFAEAVLGIDLAYPNMDEKVKALNGLRDNVQDINVVGRKLAAKNYITEKDDYTGSSSVSLGKNALYKLDRYNPEFNEKFGGVYANAVNYTDVSKANDLMDDIYNTFYKKYRFAYVPDGGFEKQAFMPNYYYDAYGLSLYTFNQKEQEIVDRMNKQLNKRLKLKLGRNVFLKPDPMNDQEYGRWVFVDGQGQPYEDASRNKITIDTKSVEAETILQRRTRMEAEEREREIARQNLAIEERPVRQLGRALAGPM